MKRYPGDEQIRDELRRGAGSLQPVDDRFYRAVWRRIASHPRSTPKKAWSGAFEELGLACWRALPACFLLVLLVGAYAFYNPPEALPEVMLTAESLVLDLADAPVDEALLYQIMNSMPDSARGIQP